jgi:hypothetical protein
MYKPSFISLNDIDYHVLQLLQPFFVTPYCLYDLSPYDQVSASNAEASCYVLHLPQISVIEFNVYTIQCSICTVIVNSRFVYTINKHQDEQGMQNYKEYVCGKSLLSIVKRFQNWVLLFFSLGLAGAMDILHNIGCLTA